MRRLIVNADDFGFTAGVNRAIVESHARGIVTSSTLMAKGTAFADAVGASPTKQIVLVLDQAGWHASQRLRAPNHVHLLFLQYERR